MRPEFIDQLQACGLNREKLATLMAEIDIEKRSLKSRLSRISSEPNGEFGRGRERQVQIRKIKDKISFLTEEREIVRAKLGTIKMDQKVLNKVIHTRSVDFGLAFTAAAERILTEEQFLELEIKASEMLLVK
jgi:hypothetical protein